MQKEKPHSDIYRSGEQRGLFKKNDHPLPLEEAFGFPVPTTGDPRLSALTARLFSRFRALFDMPNFGFGGGGQAPFLCTFPPFETRNPQGLSVSVRIRSQFFNMAYPF